MKKTTQYWSKKFDNIIREGECYELDAQVINNTPKDELLDACKKILSDENEKSTSILYALNKYNKLAQNERPVNIYNVLWKTSENDHRKIRKRSAVLMEELISKNNGILKIILEKLKVTKYLDFLQILMARLFDTSRTVEGMKAAAEITITRTIEYLTKTPKIPKSHKESTLLFFAEACNAGFMDSERGLTILTKIADMAFDLKDSLYIYFQFFFSFFYKHSDIMERLIAPYSEDYRVLLSIARLEYDALELEYCRCSKTTYKPITAKYAVQIADSIIKDMKENITDDYTQYEGIANDLFKLAGIAPHDVIPLVIDYYATLTENTRDKVQAFSLLSAVGPIRFFTDQETEDTITTFCQLALDDVMLYIKDTKSMNITCSAYFALTHIIRSYGTSTMWSGLIDKILDHMKPKKADPFRIKLLLAAIKRFNAKWCIRRVSKFILNKLTTRNDVSDDENEVCELITYVIKSLSIDTSRLLDDARCLINIDTKPFYHNMAASLLVGSFSKEILYKRDYIGTIFKSFDNIISKAPLFRELYYMVPYIEGVNFIAFCEKRKLSTFISIKHEDTLFWQCMFIQEAYKVYKDLIPYTSELIAEIEKLENGTDFVPTCIMPLCIAINHYAPSPEAQQLRDWAVKKFISYEMSWRFYESSVNHCLIMLDQLIKAHEKRSDGSSYSTTVDFICSQVRLIMNAIQSFTLELIVNCLVSIKAEGEQLSDNMLTTAYLLHSMPEFRIVTNKLLDLQE